MSVVKAAEQQERSVARPEGLEPFPGCSRNLSEDADFARLVLFSGESVSRSVVVRPVASSPVGELWQLNGNTTGRVQKPCGGGHLDREARAAATSTPTSRPVLSGAHLGQAAALPRVRARVVGSRHPVPGCDSREQ